MFQFLKEIKQAICEGVAEAREELRQEEEERKKEEANSAAERERIYSEPLSLEKLALAFSCPMREILIPGDSIRLFQFFALSEGDQKVAGKMLKRDFEIQDRESLARSVLEFQELDEKSVFICSILLYQITAAVDLGYASFEDYREECGQLIRDIAESESVNSWEDFSKEFAAGDVINHALGKKMISRASHKLLKGEDSPWTRYPWEKVEEFVKLAS